MPGPRIHHHFYVDRSTRNGKAHPVRVINEGGPEVPDEKLQVAVDLFTYHRAKDPRRTGKCVYSTWDTVTFGRAARLLLDAYQAGQVKPGDELYIEGEMDISIDGKGQRFNRILDPVVRLPRISRR